MLFTSNAEVSWLTSMVKHLKKNAVFKNQIEQLNIIKFSDLGWQNSKFAHLIYTLTMYEDAHNTLNNIAKTTMAWKKY